MNDCFPISPPRSRDCSRALPAWFWLFVWAGFQVYAAYSTGWSGNGIAWGAHIGGFLVGLALVVPMRRKTVPLFGPAEVPSGVTLANRSRDGDPDGQA